MIKVHREFSYGDGLENTAYMDVTNIIPTVRPKAFSWREVDGGPATRVARLVMLEVEEWE